MRYIIINLSQKTAINEKMTNMLVLRSPNCRSRNLGQVHSGQAWMKSSKSYKLLGYTGLEDHHSFFNTIFSQRDWKPI